MIRSIDIKQLIFQVLRPNYALTNGLRTEKGYCSPQLNTLYRFILSLIYPLLPTLESWDRIRRKSYAIAACQYGQAQVLGILNKYYGQYGQISIQVNSADMVYFYTAGEEGAVPVYIYSYNDNLMKDPTLAHFPKYDQWHSNGTYVFEEYEGRECMTVTANKGTVYIGPAPILGQKRESYLEIS